ncbi:hypothetical protein, partial [Angustibacter aerolatus]
MHGVDQRVDTELVDERLPHELAVGPRPEGLGQAGRADAERQPAPVEVEHLRVLLDQRPGRLLHAEQPLDHARPGRADRFDTVLPRAVRHLGSGLGGGLGLDHRRLSGSRLGARGRRSRRRRRVGRPRARRLLGRLPRRRP